MKRYLVILSLLVAIISCTKNYNNIFYSRLQNKKLKLISIQEKNITQNSNAYIILKEDNSFEAFSGCNNFNGTFKIDEDFIHFKINDIDNEVCKYINIQHDFLPNLVKSNKILIKNKKNYYFLDSRDNILLVFKSL